MDDDSSCPFVKNIRPVLPDKSSLRLATTLASTVKNPWTVEAGPFFRMGTRGMTAEGHELPSSTQLRVPHQRTGPSNAELGQGEPVNRLPLLYHFRLGITDAHSPVIQLQQGLFPAHYTCLLSVGEFSKRSRLCLSRGEARRSGDPTVAFIKNETARLQ